MFWCGVPYVSPPRVLPFTYPLFVGETWAKPSHAPQKSLDVIPHGQGRLAFANPTNISKTVELVDGQSLNWTLGYYQVRLESHTTSLHPSHSPPSLTLPLPLTLSLTPITHTHPPTHPHPTTHSHHSPSPLTPTTHPHHSLSPLTLTTHPHHSPSPQYQSYQSLPVGNHTVCIRQEGAASCDNHVISLGDAQSICLVMSREQPLIEVLRNSWCDRCV